MDFGAGRCGAGYEVVTKLSSGDVRTQVASATTTQTSWLFIRLCLLLNVEDLNLPLPHMEGVADVEELFLPVQSELMQGAGSRLPTKAVELPGMDTENVAQIVAPQDGDQDKTGANQTCQRPTWRIVKLSSMRLVRCYPNSFLPRSERRAGPIPIRSMWRNSIA
jgi:hypothetical protein